MGIVQEKFQVYGKKPKPEPEQWNSEAGARRSRTDATLPQRADAGSAGPSSFGRMTPAGATDVSDGINAKTLLNGYGVLPMRGTDDQYTDEHVDVFYESSGGFVERGNLLDRL